MRATCHHKAVHGSRVLRRSGAIWPYVGVLFFLASALPAAAAAEAATDTVENRELIELKTGLEDHDSSVRMHAAEALLSLGYLEDVRSAYESHSKTSAVEPHTRIRHWRVLVRVATDERERDRY